MLNFAEISYTWTALKLGSIAYRRWHGVVCSVWIKTTWLTQKVSRKPVEGLRSFNVVAGVNVCDRTVTVRENWHCIYCVGLRVMVGYLRKAETLPKHVAIEHQI